MLPRQLRWEMCKIRAVQISYIGFRNECAALGDLAETLGKGEVGGSIPLGSTSFPQQNQRENCRPKASIAARNRFKHQNIPRIAQIIRAKSVQRVLVSFTAEERS